MDELFGVTDFGNLETLGEAAQHGKGDMEAVHIESK
jgi:hypothetical protein